MCVCVCKILDFFLLIPRVRFTNVTTTAAATTTTTTTTTTSTTPTTTTTTTTTTNDNNSNTFSVCTRELDAAGCWIDSFW